LKRKFLFAGSLLLIAFAIHAQPAVPHIQTPCTTASEGTAGNFIISYTIGEMTLVESRQQSGLLITQGVLQPAKGIADTNYQCFNSAEVKVFPNPNPGTFQLQLSIFKPGKMQISLLDENGRNYLNEQFNYAGFTTRPYNIQRLTSGVYYMLLVFTENGQSKPKKCVYTLQKIN
jgi:hypothetical protein